ncbi:unnamed protein product, partial [Ilex paraguariensis]
FAAVKHLATAHTPSLPRKGLQASKITPVIKGIPTGEIASVKGTPFDFLKPQSIDSKIKDLPNGYDINYVIDGDNKKKKIKSVAVVHDKKSGIVMKLSSNVPGGAILYR